MLADRLRDEAVSRITGILNTHHAALVDQTADLIADETEWVGPGVWTIETYLQWRTGVSAATAQQLSTIARRIGDLPACLTAFRRGALTLDQMAAIARRVPGWIDTDIADLAVALTVSQLNRVLRDYPFASFDADGNEITPHPTTPADRADADPDDSASDESASNDADTATTRPDSSTAQPTSTDPAGVDEYCSYSFGDDGVFRLHLATDSATGRTITTALQEAHDRLFHTGQASVTMIDAIREVAETSLGTIDDSARAARFKTNIFLDTHATATDTAGWTLPDAIRQHLTCDGLLAPVFVDNGVPVSVGRTQRIVPDRTRTLIEQRDHGCCSVPGCTRTIGLDVHHIVHWEHDGVTDTWNLILICAHHHRQHHRGQLGITGNADLPADADGAVVFTDRTGRRILPSGATPIAPIGPTPPSPTPYQHPIGARLQPDHTHFTPRTPPTTPGAASEHTDAA